VIAPSQQLRERFPGEADGFDTFERDVAAWEARFERGERVAQGAERLYLTTGDATARRLAGIHLTNLAARAVSLADGLVLLLNEDNAHAAPPVARALFETCASATYMRRNLVPLIVKRRPERAKVMLFRLGLGTGRGEWGLLRPYRVRALVRSMVQEADDLAAQAGIAPEGGESWGVTTERLYSELSELTHPNWLATMISMTLSARLEPTWTMRPPLTEEALGAAIGTAHLGLMLGGVAWDAVIETAQKHPLLLPDDEAFGPDDLHSVPEAAEEADRDRL
jgi:hypothetical protein